MHLRNKFSFTFTITSLVYLNIRDTIIHFTVCVSAYKVKLLNVTIISQLTLLTCRNIFTTAVIPSIFTREIRLSLAGH